MASKPSPSPDRKIRLQLNMDKAYVQRLTDLAPQFRSTPSSLAAEMLAESLEMRDKLEEWYAWRIGQFFAKRVVKQTKLIGQGEYFQVYVDQTTAGKLERFAAQIGQTVAKCGGMILECAVSDDEWIMEAALRVVKGIKAVQNASKALGRKRQTS
jgi:hypothetical protein